MAILERESVERDFVTNLYHGGLLHFGQEEREAYFENAQREVCLYQQQLSQEAITGGISTEQVQEEINRFIEEKQETAGWLEQNSEIVPKSWGNTLQIRDDLKTAKAGHTSLPHSLVDICRSHPSQDVQILAKQFITYLTYQSTPI